MSSLFERDGWTETVIAGDATQSRTLFVGWVERSDTHQSHVRRDDGFRCALPILRRRTSAFSRHDLPEVCIFVRSLRKIEGAGKTGCTLHPRSRVRFAQTKMHTSIQVQRKHSGLPCAMALRLTSYSPRRTALLPPSPPRSLLLKNLTPAPRRQDHTTSPYASCALVCCAIRVHRIPPRVRDDRDPPLVTGETRGIIAVICPTGRADYFHAKGWTARWCSMWK